MANSGLPKDTQAILLLCGHFGGRDADPRPFSLTEYNRFAAWLRNEGLRPEDLLSSDGEDRLSGFGDDKISRDRIARLLQRGVELGFAVEQWSQRGVWVMSRGEPAYPVKLKQRLRASAPPLLFGVGNQRILERSGLGIVGSRDADATAVDFTREIARRCSAEKVVVVSGGARGVDQEAMQAALGSGGHVVAVLAEGVAKPSVSSSNRRYIAEGRLVLVSSYHPDARWTAGNAMGRNKHVYAMSDWTLVVSSDVKGGTWAGATENLKHRWVPLFVRANGEVPEGNRKLVQMGGSPLQADFVRTDGSLIELLKSSIGSRSWGDGGESGDLFANADSAARDLTVREGTERYPGGPEQVNAAPSHSNAPAVEPAAILESDVKDGSAERTPVPEMSDSASSASISDLFPLAWPSIALAFKGSVRHDQLPEIATRFNLLPAQLYTWVKLAVEKGLLTKQTRPVRYTMTQRDS